MTAYQRGSVTAIRLLQGEGPVVKLRRKAENMRRSQWTEKRSEPLRGVSTLLQGLLVQSWLD